MIKPMLAVPVHKGNIRDYSEWAVEEKFDGHRLIVQVSKIADQFATVQAWTRPRRHAGSDGKTMATFELPTHLIEQLGILAAGIYDGELLGGETSTDVRRTDLRSTLHYVVFDVLEAGAGYDCPGEPASFGPGRSTIHLTYEERRQLLVVLFQVAGRMSHVSLAESVNVTSEADVVAFVTKIWMRGGEGGIIKRKAAFYQPGKRSPDFIKLKKLQSTVVTIVGFEPTRGTTMNRGPFAIVVVEDAKGHRTTVKTRDDRELALFNTAGTGNPNHHPAIGRKLRIEFQDWTPKGGYRHPRWDRWENE